MDSVTAGRTAPTFTNADYNFHVCGNPDTCPAPAFWHDHCDMWPVVENYTRDLAALKTACADAGKAVAATLTRRGYATHKPVLARHATDATLQWLRRRANGDTRTDYPTHINDYLTEHLPKESVPALTPRTLPDDFTTDHLPADIDRLATACLNHEHLLVTYYTPVAVRAVASKAGYLAYCSGDEKALAHPASLEALLHVLRQYDPARAIPMQAYLHRRVPDRLVDVIRMMRPYYRARDAFHRDSNTAMNADPRLHNREEAVLAAGWTPDRARRIATLVAIVDADSLDRLTTQHNDSDDQTTDHHAALADPNTEPDTDTYSPEQYNAALEFRASLTGNERTLLRVHLAGTLDKYATKHDLNIDDLTEQVQHLLDRGRDFIATNTGDTPTELHEDLQLSLLAPIPDDRAPALHDLPGSQVARLVRAYLHGGLDLAAADLGLSVNLATKYALTALDQARHLRGGYHATIPKSARADIGK